MDTFRDPAALVRNVIEVVGGAARINVRDAVSLLDRHPIPKQAPQRT